MKRILAFALIFCLMVSVAACGSGAGPEQMPDRPGQSPENPQQNPESGEVKEEETENQLKLVDPFEDLWLNLAGMNGEGNTTSHAYVYMEINGEEKEIIVSVDVPENNGSLKNGDTLRVYFKESYTPEVVAERFGMIFTRMEAEVVINHLPGDPSYVPGEPAVVDISDYVSTYERGYDGYGTLEMWIDYDKLFRDYRQYFRLDATREDLKGSSSPYYAAKDLVNRKHVFEITSEGHNMSKMLSFAIFHDHLKNGDVINVVWKPHEENIAALTKILNVTFENSDVSYTMQNLKPLVEADPFEYMEYWLTGKNGEGYFEATISTEDSFGFSVIVNSDNNGSLSNGDVITLSIEEHMEYFTGDSGIIPTRTECEFTISGLEE